jgi:hypothetical protein
MDAVAFRCPMPAPGNDSSTYTSSVSMAIGVTVMLTTLLSHLFFNVSQYCKKRNKVYFHRATGTLGFQKAAGIGCRQSIFFKEWAA